MLSYRDSYDAIRIELAKYDPAEYDLVALMSHHGYEGDVKLAAHMPKDLHVDIILGGHSHIDMDEAVIVNDILIAQSSYGTSFVGRFDLTIETSSAHRICSWQWQRVAITSKTCSFDPLLDKLTDNSNRNRTKKASLQYVCRFAEAYHHESRLRETQLGDIIADAFKDIYQVDIVFLQSGSLRSSVCGPIVMQKDLQHLFPFDDAFYVLSLTGRHIKDMLHYFISLKPDGTVLPSTFQYSHGFSFVADAQDYADRGGLQLVSL